MTIPWNVSNGRRWRRSPVTRTSQRPIAATSITRLSAAEGTAFTVPVGTKIDATSRRSLRNRSTRSGFKFSLPTKLRRTSERMLGPVTTWNHRPRAFSTICKGFPPKAMAEMMTFASRHADRKRFLFLKRAPEVLRNQPFNPGQAATLSSKFLEIAPGLVLAKSLSQEFADRSMFLGSDTLDLSTHGCREGNCDRFNRRHKHLPPFWLRSFHNNYEIILFLLQVKGTVQEALEKLDSKLVEEIVNRQSGQTTAATNITNLQTATSNINNIPGTLSETKIDATIARDSEVVGIADAAFTTNAEAAVIADSRISNAISTNVIPDSPSDIGAAPASHDHDATYVNVGGDTMTGELQVPDQAVGPVLDGTNFNVGRTLRDHRNRIAALEGGPNFSQISGQISESQVPQYMRPAAFGTVTTNVAGNVLISNEYNLSGGSLQGECSPGANIVRVFFSTAQPDSSYTVLLSPGIGSFGAGTPAVIAKSTNRFDYCFSTNKPVEVVVYHP